MWLTGIRWPISFSRPIKNPRLEILSLTNNNLNAIEAFKDFSPCLPDKVTHDLQQVGQEITSTIVDGNGNMIWEGVYEELSFTYSRLGPNLNDLEFYFSEIEIECGPEANCCDSDNNIATDGDFDKGDDSEFYSDFTYLSSPTSANKL